MGYSAVIQQVVPEYKKAVKPAIALTSEIVTIGLESWIDFGIWFSDVTDDIYFWLKDLMKTK